MVEGIVMDNDAAVVTETAADVFIEPDIKSERVTQALYNQPVRILEERGAWTKVAVVDGSKGWLRSKAIDRKKNSIFDGDFSRRLVVTSKDKIISAYRDGGMTMKNVTMGTELYSFNEDGDSYEVYLPGNKTGWLKGSGMINLDVNEEIPLTGAGDFVSTALKFKGTCYLLRGMSSQGIDSAGLVYICARINGVQLPRTLEGQLYAGSEIKLEEAGEGDLVFIAPKGDRKSISSVGIAQAAEAIYLPEGIPGMSQ
jgi:cell wall-associated NlpC family hydrolase